MTYLYKAIITSVYDGDTVTANVSMGMNVWFHGAKLRLHGINTPEVRGEQRPQGLIARDRLRELILDKEVSIASLGRGKYGRWLVIISLDGENINNKLIEEGLATRY